MKPDDLLDALENIDDIYIKNAKLPRKPTWKTIGMIAASITLVVLLGQLSPFLRNSDSDFDSSPPKESSPVITDLPSDENYDGSAETNKDDSGFILEDGSEYIDENESFIEDEYIHNDIWIYYVEENEIKRVLEQDKRITFSELFDAWKEKNSIGEEVLLLKVSIPDTTAETIGSLHIAGDHFVMKIEVSSNLQDYFEHMDSEKLLESLKKTMLSRTNHEIKEYILTFK